MAVLFIFIGCSFCFTFDDDDDDDDDDVLRCLGLLDNMIAVDEAANVLHNIGVEDELLLL